MGKGREMCRFLKILRLKLYIILLTILSVCFLPAILIAFSPVYIFRWCVFHCSKIFRKEKGKMLSSYSSFFASDSLYTKPLCTLLVLLLCDGRIEIEELQAKFQTNCVEKKDEHGDLVYPELRQYISKWCGFFFWTCDPHYRTENHVKMYTEGKFKDTTITTNEVPDLVNELTNQPYSKTSSPWEMLLLHNINITDPKTGKSVTSGEQTLVVFRGHHSLGDGIAFRNLGLELFEYKMIQPHYSRNYRGGSRITQLFKKVWNTLTFPLRAPYEMIEGLVECFDVNEWHRSEKELTRNLCSARSDPIPIDLIKDIKNSWGSTFNGIVLAALTGGIRNYMQKNNIKIPWNMHALTPLPLPGRRDKLRNHVTAACLQLPLGRKCMKQRVKDVDKYLDNLKHSTIPHSNYLLFPLAGSLFPFMTRMIFKQHVPTVLLSIVPGPEEQVHLVSRPIVDMSFAGGLHPGTLSGGFTLLSYNGFLRVLGGMDKFVFPYHSCAQELVDEITNEFYELKKEADHMEKSV